MSEKIIYGITGLFDTPDEISKATGAVAEAGYKKYDVHTPYPVHGLVSKMKLKPSLLGYVALVLGLTGAMGALLFMWWATSVDYPLVIGGKPFFSYPAFVPIMFEVTVLMASVGTVLTMLFVYFRLPNISHPLHDTPYMKKVSLDKFGICIEARDTTFDTDKVSAFLSAIGARDVLPIYFDDEELSAKPKVFSPKFIIFLILTSIFISGVTYFTLNKLMYMVPFNWMVNQERLNPQSQSPMFPDGFGMRNPVEGTISKGNIPYPYKSEPENAGKYLLNPLKPNKKILELGQLKYNAFCSPCHGYFGKGENRMNGQFPNPPTLHSDKLASWPDGRIYHVIMEGQNIMPSYSKQLTEKERWAVILYIRALQKAFKAEEGDIK